MSLEQELKQNTEAIKELCALMERFKPNNKAETASAGTETETESKPKAEKPKAEKPKAEKPKAEKPSVELSDIQAVAATLIKAGGEAKTRAKSAIESIAGVGAKISSLPKHPEAAEVMPAVFEALTAIAADLDEEM